MEKPNFKNKSDIKNIIHLLDIGFIKSKWFSILIKIERINCTQYYLFKSIKIWESKNKKNNAKNFNNSTNL